MHTSQELQDRFPYMFSGKNLGIGIETGWLQTFAKLCQDIDALLGEDKQGFHWTQVKEKFGSARFYWNLGDASGLRLIEILAPQDALSQEKDPNGDAKDERVVQLRTKISTLARAAEAATQSLCAVCGEPGSMDSTNGHYLVVCPAHAALRKRSVRKFPRLRSPLKGDA